MVSKEFIFLSGIIIYALVVIVIGFIGKKKSISVEMNEYFLAGRSIGPIVGFFSIGATILSSFAVLGVVGWYYSHGIGTGYYLIVGVAIQMLSFTYAIRFFYLGKKYNYITIGDFMGHRFYSKSVRIFASILLTLITVPYISIQVMGLGYVVSALTDNMVPYHVGAIVLGSVMAFYIFVGGFRSVAWTNVLQGFLMTIALIFTSIYLVNTLFGGLPELFVAVKEVNPDVLTVPGPLGFWKREVWIGWSFFILAMGAFPQVVHKFFAIRDIKALRFSIACYPVYSGIIYALGLIIGLVGIVMVPGLTPIEADSVTMILTARYIPVGIGLIIALGIISAAMSTADSQYLCLSSIITRDYYQQLSKKNHEDKKLVNLSRLWVFLLLLFGIAVALMRFDTLIDILVNSVFPYGIQVFIPILAGLHWRRANKEGVLAGMAAGSIVATVMLVGLVAPPLGLHPTLWGLLAHLITLIVVTLATKAPPSDVIAEVHDYIDEVKASVIKRDPVYQAGASKDTPAQ